MVGKNGLTSSRFYSIACLNNRWHQFYQVKSSALHPYRCSILSRPSVCGLSSLPRTKSSLFLRYRTLARRRSNWPPGPISWCMNRPGHCRDILPPHRPARRLAKPRWDSCTCPLPDRTVRLRQPDRRSTPAVRGSGYAGRRLQWCWISVASPRREMAFFTIPFMNCSHSEFSSKWRPKI